MGEIKKLQKGDYLIVADIDSHYLEFRIFDIVTTEEGVPCFWPLDQPSAFPATPDIEKAEVAAHGYLKWDGCGHFSINNVHVCGRADLKELCEALDAVYAIARRHMPHYDKELAER